MCVLSTFSHQAQGSRYGNDRVATYEVFAGLCTSSAHKPAPKNSTLCAGPINLAGEREAWKQHSILRNYSQKEAKSSQGESREEEGGGDQITIITGGWMETVQDLMVADISAHNQKFLSIMWEKSLCIVSPDAPIKK